MPKIFQKGNVTSGTWGEVKSIFQKVGGTWTEILTVFQRIGGTWTKVYSGLKIPGIITIPTITGDGYVGSTFTSTTGTWSNTPTLYARQWLTSGTLTGSVSPISGATGSSFTATTSQDNKFLLIRVTATNASGNNQSESERIFITKYRAPTRTATAFVLTGTASTSGSVTVTAEGTTYWNETTTVGGVTYNIAPGFPNDSTAAVYEYSWQYLDGTAAANSTNSSTYTFSSSDAGKEVRAKVIAKNSAGDSNPAYSIYSDTVSAQPGAFNITGASLGFPGATTRNITVTWGESTDAGSYEFRFEGSQDGFVTAGTSLGQSWTGYTATSSETSKSFSVTNAYNDYRVTGRAKSGTLYTYSNGGSSTNLQYVDATGSAPAAPVITGITSKSNLAEGLYLEVAYTLSSKGSNEIISFDYSLNNGSSYTNTTSFTSSIIKITGVSPKTTYNVKIRARNDDGYTGNASSTFDHTSAAIPGIPTSRVAKSFVSGEGTLFFTTSTDTASVYGEFDYESFSGGTPVTQNLNTYINTSSNTAYKINLTGASYPNSSYSAQLIPYSGADKTGLTPATSFFATKTLSGSDAITLTNLAFSSRTTTSINVTTTPSGSSMTHIVLNALKNGTTQVTGYPKTVTPTLDSSNTLSYTGLEAGSSYTLYATPRYQYASGVVYDMAQKTITTTTNSDSYTFAMGNSLHVSTNGYINLDNAASATYDSVTLTSGRSISIFNADHMQGTDPSAYLSGATKYWSNTDTFVIQWTGFAYAQSSSASTQVRFQVKFYTGQAYVDAKIMINGTTAPRNASAASGMYNNGALVNQSLAGNLLAAGKTFRIPYSGAAITQDIAFTEIAQASFVNVTSLTAGSGDQGYATIVTAANQGTAPVTPPIIAVTPPIIAVTPPIIAVTPPIIAVTPPIIAVTPPIIAVTPPIIAVTPPIIAVTPPIIATSCTVGAICDEQPEGDCYRLYRWASGCVCARSQLIC
jgi:hypothetical protein